LPGTTTSASFPIHQGVRQGAILSPLLYSIFVDKLLDLLSTSGLGDVQPQLSRA